MAKNNAKDKKLTKTTDGDGKEFSDPDLPIEGTKDPIENGSGKQEETDLPSSISHPPSPVLPVREMVRGEDVLKIMRAKGVRI